MERPPEHRTLWVAYALHLTGGCMIGLHRIYLGRPQVVPYMILWFALSFFMLVANADAARYMINAYMLFVFMDLAFILGMLKRRNQELDDAYERRLAEME